MKVLPKINLHLGLFFLRYSKMNKVDFAFESTSLIGFSNEIEWEVIPAKCTITSGLCFLSTEFNFVKFVISIFSTTNLSLKFLILFFLDKLFVKRTTLWFFTYFSAKWLPTKP